MWVDEIGALFRDYIDEPDESYIDDGYVARALKIAYREFRRRVASQDPNAYVTRVSLGTLATRTYDMSDVANPVVILGSGALTHPRLEQLLSVYNTATDATHQIVQEQEALSQARYNSARIEWSSGNPVFFDGAVLYWASVPGAVSIRYRGAPAVDWSRLTSGDNEFVDDFDEFHDIIALLACKQYMVRDGTRNFSLDELFDRRLKDFETAMSGMRTAGPMTVSMDRNW